MKKQPETIAEYRSFVDSFMKCDPEEKFQIGRYLCRTDLFFLLWFGFARKDVEHPWLLARCKEVQENPNG
jgi:hypothetical protein